MQQRGVPREHRAHRLHVAVFRGVDPTLPGGAVHPRRRRRVPKRNAGRPPNGGRRTGRGAARVRRERTRAGARGRPRLGRLAFLLLAFILGAVRSGGAGVPGRGRGRPARVVVVVDVDVGVEAGAGARSRGGGEIERRRWSATAASLTATELTPPVVLRAPPRAPAAPTAAAAAEVSPAAQNRLQLGGHRPRREPRVGAQLREHVHQRRRLRAGLPSRGGVLPQHRLERAGGKRRHHRLEFGVVQIVLARATPWDPRKPGEPREPGEPGPGPRTRARTRATAPIRRRGESTRASSSAPLASAAGSGSVPATIVFVIVDGFPLVGFVVGLVVVGGGAEHGGERVRSAALEEFLDRRGHVEVLGETHAGREGPRREERLREREGRHAREIVLVESLEHVGDGRPAEHLAHHVLEHGDEIFGADVDVFRVAGLVVVLALLGVAQDGVRAADLLELGVGVRVARVLVGVPSERELAVRLLDRRGARALLHA